MQQIERWAAMPRTTGRHVVLERGGAAELGRGFTSARDNADAAGRGRRFTLGERVGGGVTGRARSENSSGQQTRGDNDPAHPVNFARSEP
jgi:hypothetical protein